MHHMSSEEIENATKWCNEIKKRFALNGEHKGVYFFPILNEALQHIEKLSGNLINLKSELYAFNSDLQKAPEIVRFEKEKLCKWIEALIID
jgi:hypothetical protein